MAPKAFLAHEKPPEHVSKTIQILQTCYGSKASVTSSRASCNQASGVDRYNFAFSRSLDIARWSLGEAIPRLNWLTLS